ncbi:hypothetical protein RJ641_019529 [Dillenia turbinata]|uniref:Uncharacterized protein n=1 Tax=Dillenia turbinata TaxID=194707 RepID=A0AAN8Z0W1_9MAGN
MRKTLWIEDHPWDDQTRIPLLPFLASLEMKVGSSMKLAPKIASFPSLQHKLQDSLLGHLEETDEEFA